MAKAKEEEQISIDANLIPLLLAAMGPESFNMVSGPFPFPRHDGIPLTIESAQPLFKKMAAMNPGGRSFNSYEHWFRTQKEKAREILAGLPGDIAEKLDKPKKEPKSKVGKAVEKKRKLGLLDDDEEGSAAKKEKKEDNAEGTE